MLATFFPNKQPPVMSQRHSGYQRQPDDCYQTPAWVTRAVAPYLRTHATAIWEPANGPDSKMAMMLRELGFTVVATNDDFLKRSTLPYELINCVCTNPPYGIGGRLACQFLSHALALVPVVAMLLRVDFDSGKTRTHLFRDCESFAQKIVLLDRIKWFPGDSGPFDNHAWFIWNKRHIGSATIYYASSDSTDIPAHRIITVRRGGQTEEWLTIHPSGRIEHHIENDGPRFLCRGPETRDQWIDLEYVKTYWPHLVAEVEAALAELPQPSDRFDE
jgi:hypothetical protein